jgi:hypothetical protein
MMSQVDRPSAGYDILQLRYNPFVISIPPIHAYETVMRPLFSARHTEVD